MSDAKKTSPTDREQALCLLESYLETTRNDQTTRFVMPRSQGVDELLCRWAFDRQEVSGRLLVALRKVPPSATALELELLASGSAAEAARRLHPLIGLQGRLNAYLHGLQRARRQEVDPEGDTVSLDENEVPIYICIPAGTRDRRDSTSPRRLGEMVRSWEQFKRGTAFKLDAVGPLLSNTGSTRGRSPGSVDPPEPPPGVCTDRRYFERRLAEELGRGGRQGATVSIVLIQVLPSRGELTALDQKTLARVEELVVGTLRVYDITCQQGGLELLLILPGADSRACASVVARIRERLCREETPLPLQLGIGTASFPDEGDSSLELITRAEEARARDQQRLLQGELEIDSIPASMVEGLARRGEEQPSTIWLGGVPIRMPVRVLQSDQGLRLKLPLAFLRKGTAFRLDLEHGKHCSGVLRTAELGRYRSTDDAPVVYLEITTS